jgi:hypothetical protein
VVKELPFVHDWHHQIKENKLRSFGTLP